MNNLIVSSLTLRMISDYNCIDNVDAMRLNMLAMELSGEGQTVETIKNSIGYRTAQSDFNISDEYLKELLTQAEELRSLKDYTDINYCEDRKHWYWEDYKNDTYRQGFESEEEARKDLEEYLSEESGGKE